MDTLIATLWDLEAKDWGAQKPDPQILGDNKCIFRCLNLSQFCNKGIDNQDLEERLISLLEIFPFFFFS